MDKVALISDKTDNKTSPSAEGGKTSTKIEFRFTAKTTVNPGVLVLPVFDGGKLGNKASARDKEFGGLIAHNIACDAKFTGKRGQTLSFAAPPGSAYKKVVLLGAGDPKGLDKSAFRLLGGPLLKALEDTGHEGAEVVLDKIKDMDVDAADAAAELANGMLLKSYRFDKYKAAPRSLANVTMVTSNPVAAAGKFSAYLETAEGTFLAANLANEPPNVIYPESLAQRIKDELTPLGVKIKVLDEKEMAALGMGAILAVGQGSARPPRMVVMEYDGTDGSEEGTPLALVGKGVTFDTGGISIKPGAGMEEMKMDMGGAAAVIGTMRALAGRKADVKVVGIVGLAENMPGGNAYRPGDIIKTMAGKTVNVLNTDAEGRLVLADVLAYVQKEYNPAHVVDLATLTGACVVALGQTFAGVFTNSDKLWKKIEKSGNKVGELTWRMPLHEDFAKSTQGTIADLNNMGKGRWGGASAAAEFLHAFIDASRKWAHIDMAGPGIPADGISKGFGVQLLERLVSKYFEGKGKADAPPAPAPAPASAP